MSRKKIVESFQRFSNSSLWRLQEAAYSQFGPSAWSEKGVPFYLTSNPWTADAYLSIVRGFIQDLIDKGVEGPLYIFDLGAGSGRFGYLFLKGLELFASEGKVGKLHLHYVMTDIVEQNLTFLKTHPLLKPFIEKGLLKVAHFKHDQKEKRLTLRPSQKTLECLGEHSDAPIVLIANYYFDTVPQELYQVRDGELFQGLVALKIDEEIYERSEPELISKVELSFSYEKSDDLKISPWKSLLKGHVEELEGATFLFPTGSLETLAFFEKFTSGPRLLLAGDQAFATLEQLRGGGEPQLALHGTFSLPVSYYSIRRYVEQGGGRAWLPLNPEPAFTNLVAILSTDSAWGETRNAFNRSMQFFDPWSYWKLIEHFEGKAETLQELLLLICLGKGDPMTFHAQYNRIRKWVIGATSSEKKALLEVIGLVAEQFFPVGVFDADFLMNLGVLCIDLGALGEARKLFERALTLGGHEEMILRNMRLISS